MIGAAGHRIRASGRQLGHSTTVNATGPVRTGADLTYLAEGLPRVGPAVLASIDLPWSAQNHFPYHRDRYA